MACLRSSVFKSFCNPKKRNSGFTREMSLGICIACHSTMKQIGGQPFPDWAAMLWSGRRSDLRGKPLQHQEGGMERSKDWWRTTKDPHALHEQVTAAHILLCRAVAGLALTTRAGMLSGEHLPSTLARAGSLQCLQRSQSLSGTTLKSQLGMLLYRSPGLLPARAGERSCR